MQFWASSEIHAPAEKASERVRRHVEPYMGVKIGLSTLARLDVKLRYVPIIVPEDMHGRYKERSKLRRDQKIYDCAPQLDFDVFVSGTFEAQLEEYFRGIALAAPHLKAFGATPEQVSEFEAILAAGPRILAVESDRNASN